MRYAIISDIHGNAQAFEAVIESCRQEGVGEYYCLGDIVGYGADPSRCIELIQEIDALTIAGNHDWAVLGKTDVAYFNQVAQAAVYWTQNELSLDHHNYLTKLSLVEKREKFIMVHGTLNRPEAFNYLIDMNQASDTFYLMDRKLCFIGHTHVPQILIKDANLVSYSRKLIEELKGDKTYIVNVGSVGQPRDSNPNASFCIYDPDLMRIEIKRVSYNVSGAQQKILKAGLPPFLAKRLALGQ